MTFQDPEQKVIWDFLNSRPRVTYRDIASACPGSAWKRENYLLRLRKSGVLKFCGREGHTQYFTVFDVDAVNAQAAVGSTAEQDRKWSAHRLDTKLQEMSEKATGEAEISYEPEDKDELSIWTFARSVARFTVADVSKACGISESKRNAVLRKLTNTGLIREWGRENRVLFYTALTPKEQHSRSKDLRRTKTGDIWTAIRIRRVFSPEDILASLASNDMGVKLKDVADYCKMLHQAGYLQEIRQAKSQKTSKRYRLIKNTGPLPPVKKRVSVVIDGNEDLIVHASGGRLA